MGLKFDMNGFLDNLSKLNCQDSSQNKSACQKNNWILYFCCNCDRHVALLFKVDGSDKKKNQYWLVCSFYQWKSLLNIYEIWNSRARWFHFCYLPVRSQLQCGFVFIIILSGQLALTSYTYQTRTPIPAWWSYMGRYSSPVCRDCRPHSYLPGSPSWAAQCASVCKSSEVL